MSRLARQDAGTTWHQADLLDPTATRRLLEAVQPTHVLHLAWGTMDGHHWDSRENFDWVVAGVRLIEAVGAVGSQRLVLAGTCAEYAHSATPCVEEVTPLRPPSVYGACKAAVSTLLPAYASTLGVASWAWARLFHPYGEGDRAERFIPTLIRTLSDRQQIACTPGHQRRDFMHIEDAAEALARLVDSDVHGPINIASGLPVAVRTFVTAIARQLGGLELVNFGARPASALDLLDLTADVTRQRAELGFEPMIPMADGVGRMLAWYRAGGRFR